MDKRLVAVVTAVVVIAVVAAVIIYVSMGDDEAPIIVKNGSMTIDTSDGTWQDDGGAWRNETGQGGNQNELWVRVDLTNGPACKGTGHPVHIDYSVPGFQAMFNVTGGKTPRTIVAPKAGLQRETNNKRLRHGTAEDGGFITAVRIPGSPFQCNITQRTLVAINICSSPDVDACK